MEVELDLPSNIIDEHGISDNYNFLHSLAAGAVAGLVVDIVLFPIDTVKTRLQCEAGFWRSGGFKGVYKGLLPTAAGSAPTAALFFCAYDSVKNFLGNGSVGLSKESPYTHMLAASTAEVLACLIRVPVEIAKQRSQTSSIRSGKQHLNAVQILHLAYKTEGLQRGLYRGFYSTIAREIPFSLVQFPLWEFFKLHWTPFTGLSSTPITVALCGALAGGIGAAVTTPLDVVKTRIMLAEHGTATKRLGVLSMFSHIYQERGLQGLFAGILPRVTWITLGGAFFFGFYDLTTRLLKNNNTNQR